MEWLFGITEKPISDVIIVAFIGFIGGIFPQMLVQKHHIDNIRKEKQINYIGALRFQVLDTHDRMTIVRRRRIEAGTKSPFDNSMIYIDGKRVRCYDDIKENLKDPEWYYGSGFNLCSYCYSIACLIAQCYRAKQNLEMLRLNKRQLNRLLDYLLRVEGFLDRDFGIWQGMQYDIAKLMVDQNGNNISFQDFVALGSETRCFCNIYNFCLDIAHYGRRRQELDIIITLYDFYFFLENVITPSYTKRVYHVLVICGLLKRIFLQCDEQPKKENNMEIGLWTEEVQNDWKKVIELGGYLYSDYLSEEKDKKQKCGESVKVKRLKIRCLKIRSKRFKKQRIPYYEKAISPISSYIELKGLKDEYKKERISL